jgi:hypothetical protein
MKNTRSYGKQLVTCELAASLPVASARTNSENGSPPKLLYIAAAI